MRHLLVFIHCWLTGLTLLAQTSLKVRLDKLMEADFLRTSEVGLIAYDLTADSLLYAYQEKKLYRPASIEKLITAITALEQLGPGHRFETAVFHTGQINEGQLDGDLYIVGGFDSEFDEEGMEALADAVSRAGIAGINGKIYGDVSMKDSLYWGSGWSWDDNPYYFQPYLSPLLYHKGYVTVTARPTLKDSAAAVSCTPASSFYTVCNRTKSQSPSAGKFEVTRNWLEGGNEILVRGNVTATQSDRVNLCGSQDFFLHVFCEHLAGKGIRQHGYAYRECPPDSTVCIGTYSHTLEDVLLPALKKSDNLSAEALFYRLATSSGHRPASAEDAIKAIEAMIERLGYTPKNYRIADGSGVSLYNYISPELLLAFLKYAYSHPDIYRSLYASLPIAGMDGTLRNRMKNSPAYKKVRAKTGSLTGVSSLAGYATASDGHTIAFVVINQNILEQQEAKRFQNRVCEELCR